MGERGVSVEYNAEVHPRQAMTMCERGATDREVAEIIGCSLSTFYRWRNEHPEFSESLVVGRDAADDRVERSLYNRAVGYSYDSEKLITVSQGTGSDGASLGSVVERHDIVEHVPPDVKAATRWLESRRPKVWRRTLGVGAAPEDMDDINFDALSDTERAEARRLWAKMAAGGGGSGGGEQG